MIVSNLNGVCASMSLMSYQTRADEALEQSEALREQRKCAEAEKVVQQLLDEYPRSSAGLAELSLILVCRSQGVPQKVDELLTQALQHAQRATFLAPTNPQAFEALATTQSSLGAHREALTSARRSLELHPHPDSALRLFVGEQTLRTSKAEGDQQLSRLALEYADQVIAQEPGNVRAWTLRADANNLRMADGTVKWDENLADFERILQLDPTNARAADFCDFLRAQRYQHEASYTLKAKWNEALEHLKANENEKALPLLKHILGDEPDNRPALSHLCLALRRLKRFDEALSVQNLLARLDSTPEMWRLAADIALQSNNYGQANKAYLQVVQLLPDEARSYRDVAITFEKMGGVEEAIPYWRRALELTPEDQEAWLHLGKDLLNVGCSQSPVNESLVCEAIPALNKAQALDGNNTEIMSQLAVGVAEVGDSEMAFEYASRIARRAPVAHSVLVPLLTNIQSRRLSEGLPSKPLSCELVPLLMPPRLPIQNMGAHVVDQSFSPIRTRSVSPWLVGVLGLLVIFGLRGALHLAESASAAPSTTIPPNPSWNEFSNIPPQQPPFQSSAAALPPRTMNHLIGGWWKGSLAGDSARLFINSQAGESFTGTIFIDKGDITDQEVIDGLQIRVEGMVSTTGAISWRETEIISNPHNTKWALGEETGALIQRGTEEEMRGTGKAGETKYIWSFTRGLELGNSAPSNETIKTSHTDAVSASEAVVPSTKTEQYSGQPDALIRVTPDEGESRDYIGAGVYSEDGSQRATTLTFPGYVQRFDVQIKNTTRKPRKLRVKLSAIPTGWHVTVSDALHLGANITGKTLRTEGWLSQEIAPHATKELRLELIPKSTALINGIVSLRVENEDSGSGQADEVQALATLQRVGRIEYTLDPGKDGDGANWQPVPQDGVAVPKESVLGVRVTRGNKNAPWPDEPFKPTWTRGADQFVGDSVWLQFSDVTPPGAPGEDIHTECGNIIHTKVRVLPEAD